jgi:hypothetical protein
MLPLPPEEAWRASAACLGMDAELFVPEGKGFISVEAFRTCRSCPVRVECLEDALSFNEPGADEGVFGGTTGRHRDKVRLGRMTRERAMASGDALAENRTREERVSEDEPWLAGAERVVPVAVRRRLAS